MVQTKAKLHMYKQTLPHYSFAYSLQLILKHNTGKFGGCLNFGNLADFTEYRQIKVFRWTQRHSCSSHACDNKNR